MTGRVLHVSRDMAEREALGQRFPPRIGLERPLPIVEGTKATIMPGVSVTADVIIDDRHGIEFLIAPLLQIQSEGLRER